MNEEARQPPPADLGETTRCVAEIKLALQERRAPKISGHAPEVWARALDLLQLGGNLAATEHGARHLHAAYPGFVYARNMSQFFDLIPPADGALLPFSDNKSGVQPVLREGADTVLLAFCDAVHRLGMPLYAIHRWLGRLPASLVYLRDFRRLCYLGGIPSLGDDRAATLAALRAMVDAMHARRIVCLGISAGGFGALHYGLELGAEVSKEAPGEVVRTDTVMIYRTDTLQLTTRVVDTVRMTRTRVDTVIPRLPKFTYPKGFYGGLAGGFSVPSGSLYTPNSTGGTGQLQLGWNNAKQALGGRFDVNGAWPGRDSRFSAFQGQATLWNFSLDGKLQWPFNFGGPKYKEKDDPCEPAKTYTRGAYHRFAIYGIGGFTYTTYHNLPHRVGTPGAFDSVTIINGNTITVIDRNNPLITNNVNLNNVAFFVPGEDNWHSRGGWNAGGGVSMMWGHSELFLEARVMGFKPNESFNGFDNGHSITARQVPVVFGFNWY